MKKFRNLIKDSRVEDEGFASVAAGTLKHKQNKEPMPKLKEENDTTEKKEMAETQLHFIKYAAEEILEYIDMGGEIEEWYQNKLSKVQSDLESLHSYIEGEKRRTGMVDEATGDAKFDKMMKRVTSKKEVTKQQKTDTKQQARDAFGSMFGGGNPANKLGIRKPSVAEATSVAVRLQRAAERQRAKSDASLARTPSSIPKKEEVEQIDEIAVVKTNKPIGTRVANIGPGGKEYNVKTNKAYDDAKKKKPQGAFFATQRRKERLASSGRMDEEDTIQEGRPSQRHPLEGHEYHKKSNDALVHIAKDAHKAAEAMKGHNTTAENKYRDQANDSATVRYFRQKSGMPDWYKKKYGHMKEDIEQIDEKNEPTNPSLWSRAKSLAKSKFDVYPSAYANGWASKWYKSKGGGWRTVSEAEERGTEPFLKTSRKTEIVKNIAKKKLKLDKFESDPILSSTVTRNQ